MEAFIFTADPSFQVIFFGKNKITILINVIIDILLQHCLVKQLYKNSIPEMFS